jgi:tryptophan synthase alpha chain
MTYYNIAFQYGVENFVKDAGKIGVKGIILPDLPIEEADEFVDCCEKFDVAPIFLFTPTTSEARMKQISEKSGGFTYCQARVGVTGTHTQFGKKTREYIEKCKKNSKLPISFGFGIQEKSDVDFLKGKVDIAICCTAAVKVLEKEGAEAMSEFLKRLR